MDTRASAAEESRVRNAPSRISEEKQIEVLQRFYDYERAQARHHELQRTQSFSFLMGAIAVVLGFAIERGIKIGPVGAPFDKAALLLAALLFVLSLFLIALVLKFNERMDLHRTRAYFLKQRILYLCDGRTWAEAEERHKNHKVANQVIDSPLIGNLYELALDQHWQNRLLVPLVIGKDRRLFRIFLSMAILAALASSTYVAIVLWELAKRA